jgi:hypothetical protein
VEQELLTFPEHLSSPPVFSGVRVTRSLVLTCRSTRAHHTYSKPKEGIEDTKGVIRIRISKNNRQHNGQEKKYKRTNNDLQNTTKDVGVVQSGHHYHLVDTTSHHDISETCITWRTSIHHITNNSWINYNTSQLITNNDVQYIHIKLKIEWHEPH